jgi:hypothetical protein
MGVARIAEQPRAICADLHDAGDDLVGVALVGIVAAIDEGAPHPLAQGAVVGEGQHRIHRGAGVDDRILAGGQVALARRRGGSRLDVGGHAGEVGLAGDDPGGLVGEQLLAELGEQPRQLLVVGGELLLLRRVEIGAAADELVVKPGHHALLLGVEAGAFARLVDRLDPLEQSRVEDELVIGGGEARLPFALERLIVGIGHVVGHHAEHGFDPVEPLAGALERLDGVGEGGRRRIVRDREHLAITLVDRELEGRREQVRPHLVERRHAVERTAPIGEQDVVGNGNRDGRGRLGGGGLGGFLGRHASAERQGSRARHQDRLHSLSPSSLWGACRTRRRLGGTPIGARLNPVQRRAFSGCAE